MTTRIEKTEARRDAVSLLYTRLAQWAKFVGYLPPSVSSDIAEFSRLPNGVYESAITAGLGTAAVEYKVLSEALAILRSEK